MKVLAIDTSHAVGSLALSVNGYASGKKVFGSESSHLQAIGNALRELCMESRMRIQDIERIALVLGPGSFTGLRVGMSFAKGLLMALGCKLVGIDTLKIIAMPLLERGSCVVPMIDARKDEVYAAAYVSLHEGKGIKAQEILSPRVEDPESFLKSLGMIAEAGSEKGKMIFAGTGSKRYAGLVKAILKGKAEMADDQFTLPSTEYLAVMAPKLSPLFWEDIRHLEPLYLRPSGAKLKRLRDSSYE